MSEKQDNAMVKPYTIDLEQVREKVETLATAGVDEKQIFRSAVVYGKDPEVISQMVEMFDVSGEDLKKVTDDLQTFDSGSDEDSIVKGIRR